MSTCALCITGVTWTQLFVIFLCHCLSKGGAQTTTDGVEEKVLWAEGCPIDCTCLGQTVECDGAELAAVLAVLPNVTHLRLVDVGFDADELDPALFVNATRLTSLALVDCDLETVRPRGNHTPVNDRLRSVDLTDNDFESFDVLAHLADWWPSLSNVTLDNNELDNLTAGSLFPNSTGALTALSMRHCELERLPETLPDNLLHLDASNNEIESINGQLWPKNLASLNLSNNKLSSLPNGSLEENTLLRLKSLQLQHNAIDYIRPNAFTTLPALTHLNLSSNPIEYPLISTPSTLEHFALRHSEIRYFNLTHLAVNSAGLKEIDLSYNDKLVALLGKLAPFRRLERLRVSNCSLRSLPNDFFRNLNSRPALDIGGNAWQCGCSLLWAIDRPDVIPLDALAHCLAYNGSTDDLAALVVALDRGTSQCDGFGAGLPAGNATVVRYLYGHDAVVHCDAYALGRPPDVVWRRHLPHVTIGRWMPNRLGGTVLNYHTEHFDAHKYEVLPGGALLIRSFKTGDIERYYCTVVDGRRPAGNASLTMLLHVRQDLHKWFEIEVISYFVGAGTTMVFFTIYMLWTALRKFIVWRIDEMEKSSRMQNMIEAMEKYRQRQMEALHEKYAQSVQAVRDQYAAQVEQVQRSYAMQAGRLRDYRDTRMEQLAAARDGYNAQMQRVREYGAGRMERLWESYERQMNRIRTFSLQSRLRLQRQHKISQRYLKKLYSNMDAYKGTPPLQKEIPELPESSVDDLALPFLSPSALRLPDAPPLGLNCIIEESPEGSFHSLPDWGGGDIVGASSSAADPEQQQQLLASGRQRRNSADEPGTSQQGGAPTPQGQQQQPQRAGSGRKGFKRGHRKTDSYDSARSGSSRTPPAQGSPGLSSDRRPMQVRFADQRAPLQALNDETAL